MNTVTIIPEQTAAVAVDFNKGFIPGDEPGYGQLPAEGGADAAQAFAAIAPVVSIFAASGDGHTEDHPSFQLAGGPGTLRPDGTSDGMWPPHCVMGTPGAELHPQVVQLRQRRPRHAASAAAEWPEPGCAMWHAA